MRSAEELRFLVLAADMVGKQILTAELRPLGITPSQAEVLRVLADNGSMTLVQLGSHLVCESGNSPSRLVDRLVKRGYIDRQAGTSDARTIELALTPSGVEAARSVAKIEARLHDSIDHAAPDPLQPTLDFLWAFVANSAPGEALKRRKALAAPRATNHEHSEERGARRRGRAGT